MIECSLLTSFSIRSKGLGDVLICSSDVSGAPEAEQKESAGLTETGACYFSPLESLVVQKCFEPSAESVLPQAATRIRCTASPKSHGFRAQFPQRLLYPALTVFSTFFWDGLLALARWSSRKLVENLYSRQFPGKPSVTKALIMTCDINAAMEMSTSSASAEATRNKSLFGVRPI